METTIRERMEIYIHAPGVNAPMCVNCAHYYPHYRKDGYSYGCGHCCYPRMKPRKAYDLCKYFKNKEDTE